MGDGRVVSPEVTLVMTPPPCSIITRASARAHSAVSTRFWSTMSRQNAPSISTNRAVPRPAIMPTLLTAMSSRPPQATTSATSWSIAASSRRSATNDEAVPPSSAMSATVSLAFSARMSFTATEAPARAIHRAISRPIPAPDPVTSATLPEWSISTLIPRFR